MYKTPAMSNLVNYCEKLSNNFGLTSKLATAKLILIKIKHNSPLYNKWTSERTDHMHNNSGIAKIDH